MRSRANTCPHPDRPHHAHGMCKPCWRRAHYRIDIAASRIARRDATRQLRLDALLALGGQCVVCGESDIRVLQIDHIDGNSDNHKEENLILICPNCHSLTLTYGARNKGSGRTYRRVQYKNQKIKELELDNKIKELQQTIL